MQQHFVISLQVKKGDMVPKASQRTNGQQLATHLLNARDNERVQVAHIRGAVARDLHGAFKEWHAVSKVTRCKKYLYSLSINPDPKQPLFTRQQYSDFIGRVEKKLGLAGQPRAIVFHVKGGREHCHVVWSRIIPGDLKAVQIAHDRKSLQAIVRRFNADHGLSPPHKLDDVPASRSTLDERHQEERTGLAKKERLREITRLWRATGTGREFIAALAEAGYRLARGGRVPYAIIDAAGEIHSLPRQIDGVRTNEVRARLSAYPPDSLPDAVEVKAQVVAKLAAARTRELFNKQAAAARALLSGAHEKRRSAFHGRLTLIKEKHHAERNALIATQERHWRDARTARIGGWLARLLRLIPGARIVLACRERRDDASLMRQYRHERHLLAARQRAAFDDLKRQARALARVEKRELRSLQTSLRRTFLCSILQGSFAAASTRQNKAIPHDRGSGRDPPPAGRSSDFHGETNHNLRASFSASPPAILPRLGAAFAAAAARPATTAPIPVPRPVPD